MSYKDIINKIKKLLPNPSKISDYSFEGANIVLYSKDKNFVLNSSNLTKKIVDIIKKRVEVRADELLLEDVKYTQNIISKVIPKEAGIENIWFDEKRSQVIIEVEEPSIAIGKDNENLRAITQQTFWIPIIKRRPAINSPIINNIRLNIYKNSNFRRKFLNNLGEKIYSDWERNNKYWVRVSCLGGCREVGRSSLLVQTPNSNVLLDCGVNIATNKDFAYPHLDAPEFNIKELDAVIITHAHLDHCGFLPVLFKYGYEGPIYCTEPTRDIMTLMLLDYINIGEKENNKLIFNSNDVKDMIKHIVCIPYKEVNDITPDFRLTLFNSGHILGSSMIHLNIGNGYHNLLYSGDYKFAKTKLLSPATIRFQRVETLISESTYGGKNSIQPSIKESEEYLSKIIIETIKRKGKVLIPVLGVGRAQEVMVIVEELMSKKKIPEIPIYIDGMVKEITAIHSAYPEFLNNNMKRLIFKEKHNPFLNNAFKRPLNQKERLKIVQEINPCIILATSGMLTGGPSVFYLEHLAENKKNSLIFVSYQGKGSLGSIIQRGDKKVTLKIVGNKRDLLNINLEVYTIEGLSGHSDRNQLMDYMTKIIPRPKKIIVDHGESSRELDLASSVYKKLKIETVCPKNLEIVRIG